MYSFSLQVVSVVRATPRLLLQREGGEADLSVNRSFFPLRSS